MSNKSFVRQRKWLIPPHKRGRSSKIYKVKPTKPGFVSIQVRREIVDYKATITGFNDFLIDLIGRGVRFEENGHRKGILLYPSDLANKIKEFLKNIRRTARKVLKISHLDLEVLPA